MSAAAVEDAVARKKLRVSWPKADAASRVPPDAVLAGLWTVLRQRHEAPGASQDERLEVVTIVDEPGDAGLVRITVRYVFDHDFASQYDQTETFVGEVVLDARGAPTEVVAWAPASG